MECEEDLEGLSLSKSTSGPLPVTISTAPTDKSSTAASTLSSSYPEHRTVTMAELSSMSGSAASLQQHPLLSDLELQAPMGASHRYSAQLKQPQQQQPTSPWQLLPDIAIVFVMLGIAIAMEEVRPRHSYITFAALPDYAYPAFPNSVPSFSVLIFAGLGPILAILAWKAVDKRLSHHDMHRVLLAFLLTVAVTAAVTNAVKVPIGRPRPNFVQRCWPDGVQVWESKDTLGGYPKCTCDEEMSRQIRKSFPSGHSSWSASGLGFLSLLLLGQARPFAGGVFSGWRLVLPLLPAVGAVAVGITRVTDCWHHPTDVLAGLGIGFSVAYTFYRQLFPSLASDRSDVMYNH
ncbi:MAG: hypothetical protein WDW36_005410 [Sanguina aurantia]